MVDNWRKKLDLSKKVLDLACGTGKHLKYFRKLGYDCQGIDASHEMLKIAKRKLINVPLEIGFFHNFKLKEKVPVITSFFNSMSYNIDKEELNETLKNVYRNLSHGGIFVFDMICNASPKKVFAVKTFEEENLKFSRTFVGIPTPKGFKSTMLFLTVNLQRLSRKLRIEEVFQKKK
ncbi:MAG: class I SAM-dependent methyltransferase [Methanomicrobia archaeon]|nr:class I SAM-dependent methyltransferase [Methanomicrobia archaeon]